jgi:hypothetical protein
MRIHELMCQQAQYATEPYDTSQHVFFLFLFFRCLRFSMRMPRRCILKRIYKIVPSWYRMSKNDVRRQRQKFYFFSLMLQIVIIIIFCYKLMNNTLFAFNIIFLNIILLYNYIII